MELYTKEDCYKIGYFSEKYFIDGYDKIGNYVFFDRETGEVAAIISKKEEIGQCQKHSPDRKNSETI